MDEAKSIISDLERRLNSGTPEEHAEIMRRVTDLFLTTPVVLSTEQIFLFDDIVQKLAGYLERQTLVDLGMRIAVAPSVPPQVLRRFASDNIIEIAGPILARSEHLSEANLVEIAERKSQLHLAKIAERRHLSEMITDVLVDRGNREVLSKVAANYGARFSRLGMSTLAMRADGDDELISIIAQRSDIPTAVYTQLLSYATENTRKHLLAMTSESPDVINRALNSISAHASVTITGRGVAAAQRFYRTFRQDIEQTRTNIHKLADSGRIIEIVAALSVLSGLPIELVDRLICNESAFGVMVLCKAIDLDWPMTHAVLGMRLGTLSRVFQVEKIHDDFERLSVSSARRLMSHWQGRLSVQVA